MSQGLLKSSMDSEEIPSETTLFTFPFLPPPLLYLILPDSWLDINIPLDICCNDVLENLFCTLMEKDNEGHAFFFCLLAENVKEQADLIAVLVFQQFIYLEHEDAGRLSFLPLKEEIGVHFNVIKLVWLRYRNELPDRRCTLADDEGDCVNEVQLVKIPPSAGNIFSNVSRVLVKGDHDHVHVKCIGYPYENVNGVFLVMLKVRGYEKVKVILEGFTEVIIKRKGPFRVGDCHCL